MVFQLSIDQNISKVINNTLKIKKYSIKDQEANKLREILQVPGSHNVSNALLASKIAKELGISEQVIQESLASYTGSWRRFDISDISLNGKKITLIDDYAHHPTEIEATLKAVKEKFKDRIIWGVFQPHQYNRTYLLFNDFVKTISENKIDKLIITDIYDVAGRENTEIKAKVSSENLVKAIDKPWVRYLSRDSIINYLKDNLRGGEVLMILGAGDVYNILDSIRQHYIKNQQEIILRY